MSDPISIPVQAIFNIVNMINTLGHADAFKAAANEAKLTVTVSADTIEFVKNYISCNNLHVDDPVSNNIVAARQLAAAVVRPTRDCADDFGCNSNPHL